MKIQSFTKIWRWPLVLALIIAVGLLSALLGTGIWTEISWILLLIPVAVLARFTFFQKRRFYSK